MGARPSGRLRHRRAQDHRRRAAVFDARRRLQSPRRLRQRRSHIRVRPSGRRQRLRKDDGGARSRRIGRDHRVPGAADHHLRRGADGHPLLLRRHADRGARLRRRDAPPDARERRRIAQHRGQCLPEHDGGAADDSTLPGRSDGIRAHDRHDLRDGARVRRDDGRLPAVRRGGEASAGGGHHDGSGHAGHREDAGAGNRGSANDGDREARDRAHRRQHHRRGCPGDGRWPDAGPERRRDAHLVHRA